MPRTHRVGVGLLALSLFVSGCYGPFNLTRRLHHWNGQVGSKWENEFVFLVLAWLPVYGLATLGDALIFNSMEFWTGKNPVDPPSAALPQTRRIARGSDEAVLTYRPVSDGAELFIEQFQQGKSAGSLRVTRRDGMTVGLDADGKVLVSSRSMADGSILIHDGSGKQMAAYSADRVEQLLGAADR